MVFPVVLKNLSEPLPACTELYVPARITRSGGRILLQHTLFKWSGWKSGFSIDIIYLPVRLETGLDCTASVI